MKGLRSPSADALVLAFLSTISLEQPSLCN